MTSLRQIEANRRNARKSTGPKTGEGKRRSRRNAVRHAFERLSRYETAIWRHVGQILFTLGMLQWTRR